MRRLNERNKSYVYFMPCKGTQRTQDADGLYTGEDVTVYNAVTEARMVVGTNTGLASLKEFGISDDYSVKLVTDDVNCTMAESSIVWLGLGKVEPFDEDKEYQVGDVMLDEGELWRYTESHQWDVCNYTHVVTRVAKSFGYITYLLKQVSFDFRGKPLEPIPSA